MQLISSSLVLFIYFVFQLVADKVVQLTEGKKVSKILDIGCGDGLVGKN